MGPAFMRKYATGAGADIYLPMIKAGSNDFAVGADWTPVAGDVKVSIDGGAQANIASLPTYSEGSWVFTFSNAELTGKKISVRIVDTAVKAVEDQAFEIETFGHASAAYQADLSAARLAADAQAISGDTGAADALETMLDGTGGNVLVLKQLQIINNDAGFNTGCVYIQNNGDGNGVIIGGGGSGSGLSIIGGDTGYGVSIAGGATSGPGMRIRAQANNDHALVLQGDGAGLDLSADFVTTIDGINAKTTNLPADPADASDIAAAFLIVTNAIGALENLSQAQVLAAITQALRTDSGTELAAIPAKDAPLAAQIQLLFQALRNGFEQDATSYTIYNDAGVAIGTALVSAAPALVTRGKLA